MALEHIIESDVLVIGGGMAGFFAAIKAREKGQTVTLVDKSYAGKSGASAYAGMGYIVYNPEWGLDLNAFLNAMYVKGEYLNDHDWAEIILKDSFTTYLDLASWGVEFPIENIDNTPNDKYFLPFGVVRIRRRQFMPLMRKQAARIGVKILDRITITDLLKQDGKVVGAIGFPVSGYETYVFNAKATVLSTGYNSFKPSGAEIASLTGDGEAMAYRIGAEITGKEFPDTGTYGMTPYTSWRGGRGSRAVFRYYTLPSGERVPVGDEQDLSLEFKIHSGEGPILWDLDAATAEDIERMRKRMMASDLMESKRIGFDPAQGGKIPVAGGGASGASNPHTAGIWPEDKYCATKIPGLYVAGENCASRYLGSYHPAPGFGLTGAAVTGMRAGLGAAGHAGKNKKLSPDKDMLTRYKKDMFAPVERKGGFSPRWVTQLIQNTMTPYFVLHIKKEDRLKSALTYIEFIRNHLVPKLTAGDSHELRLAHETDNMALNAEMILRASLARKESRGMHYREDYPGRDDPAWLAWIKIRDEQGEMKTLTEPVPEKWWPDLSKPYEERYPKKFPGE
jgi:succinate dehydrogenase/fumarate reductase flavoprotein subunit